MKTIDITRMPANFVTDIHDILVVKDSDKLFPVEILNSVPKAAKHWDEYNDKNIWDKRRFKNTKYVAVACIGDPYDYSYEEVGWTNYWKEARKMDAMGANIYCGNQRVYFVDHKAVQEAYDDLQFDEIVGFDMVSNSAFEADVRRKSANDVLEQNGFKADEEWKKKVEARYEQHMFGQTYGLPFYERHPFHCCFNNKTGKYENGKIETDDLPF